MAGISRSTAGIGAFGLACFAAGAALGLGAERLVVNRTFRYDPDAGEAYGQLRAEEHRLVVPDGTGLHVEVDTPEGFRPGIDPTLIFAHGFCCNSDCWYYQRRDLAGLGRIVVYDQRSHGRSDRAPNGTHTIDQLGHDLRAVMDDTAPEGPVILIGHSMGGMTVMAFAMHFPELIGSRVKGVGLLSTSAGGLDTVTFGLPRPARALMRRYLADAAALAAAQQPLVDPARHRATDLSQILTKIYAFGGWSSASMTAFVNQMVADTPIDVIVEYLPAVMEHDKLEHIDVLQRIPTLVMVGDHDLMTPTSHSEEILRRVPEAEFIVMPASGHMAILERHATVNLRLRHMVQRALAE